MGAPADGRARAEALAQRGDHAGAAAVLAPLAAAQPQDADLQYRLGLAYQRAGNINGASAALNRAAQLRPTEAVYAAALARMYASVPHPDRASFWYRKLLRLRPKNPALAIEAAEFMLRHNRPLDAELMLKQATRHSGKSAELWLLLAQCYRAMDLTVEEARALERAVYLKPAEPEQLRQLIELYAQAGQPEKALPYLQMAARLHPGDPRVQVRIAECYLAVNDRTAAIGAYRAAARTAPRDGAIRTSLAQLLAETDPAAALEEYEAAFRLQQPTGEQLLAASALAARSGAPEAAGRYLAWLVALQPANAAPRQHLIEGAIARGDMAAALQQWRELQMAGERGYAVSEAELALRLGGREWALGKLQEVADGSAGDPALQAHLAALFEQLHDSPRAQLLAQAALSGARKLQDPANRETRLLAATVLVQAGRPEEAEKVFRQLLQADPRDAAAVRGLALSALEQGQVRAAWEQLSQALRDHSHDSAIASALIDAAGKAEEYAATAQLLQLLVEAEPDNDVLVEALVWLYRRQGGTALAAEKLAEMAEWEPRKGIVSLTAARELAAAGRAQEAAALYERLARGSDFMSAARTGLCDVLLAAGRYTELLSALARLTGPQAIGDEAYRLLLGIRAELSLQSGARYDALAVAQAATAVSTSQPQSEAYYLGLADLYLSTGQAAAGVDFLQTEASAKATAQAGVALARVLRHLQQGREALVWLDQAGPAAQSPMGLLERAQCLLQVKQIAEAGRTAERALHLLGTGGAVPVSSATAPVMSRQGGLAPSRPDPAAAEAYLPVPPVAQAHLIAAEACAQGYRPEEALWHLVQALMGGGPPHAISGRLVALCSTQELSETAVMNALQQLYAHGERETALAIADSLLARPGFARLRDWMAQRVRPA